MRLSSKTTKMLILAVVIALGFVGAYGWLLWSVWQTKGAVEQIAGTIDARAREEERLRTTEDLLDATVAERETLSSYFVTEETVVDFIEAVEGLGASAGVSVTTASVETEDSAPEEDVSKLPLLVLPRPGYDAFR